MFESTRKIRVLEYEVKDLKDKYWALSYRFSMLLNELGYKIYDEQPKTVIEKIEKEKAG